MCLVALLAASDNWSQCVSAELCVFIYKHFLASYLICINYSDHRYVYTKKLQNSQKLPKFCFLTELNFK